MTALVSRADLERFARACQTAHGTGALPADQLKALHAKFMARGNDGAVWTVGLATLKWHVARDGKWQPGEPVAQLAIDDELLARLRSIESLGQGAKPSGDAPPRPAAQGPPPGPTPGSGEVRTFAGHGGKVLKVGFTAEGRHAVSIAEGSEIQVWDVATGKSVDRLVATDRANVVALAPDRQNVMLHDGALALWDIHSRRRVASYKIGSYGNALAFAPDGRSVIYGHSDSSLRLLDLAQGRELRRLVGHSQEPECVAISPDGRYAVSGRIDFDDKGDSVMLWDLRADSPPRRPERQGTMPSAFAFTRDSAQCVTVSWDGDPSLWDTASGRELRTFAGHKGNLLDVVFTPNGRCLLTASGTDDHDDATRQTMGIDNTVRLWEVTTGKELACFRGHEGNVNSVAVSADGRFALSGGSDRTIRLWALPTSVRP